jgi:integrase
VFYPAREVAGRPDLRFHDLRHTGAVLAAATGATLAELMARLGHSTVSAALKYRHAAADRDKAIAAALPKLHADVIPIRRAGARRNPASG